MNDIALTVRIPQELNLELTDVSKRLGMTKTNLIRMSIHTWLLPNIKTLDFSAPEADKQRSRLVLNVNQLTHDILIRVSEECQQSINATVIAACRLAIERASKWLL